MADIHHQADWSYYTEFKGKSIPLGVSQVLNEPDSMSERMRRACQGELIFKVLRHEMSTPSSEESAYLGDDSSPVLIREVLISCSDKPWMYGRSVFPAGVLKLTGEKLRHLGDESLGDVLFSYPNMRRSEFEFTELNAQHDLFHMASHYSRTGLEKLWARRSLFYLSDQPLLLSEVFYQEFMR